MAKTPREMYLEDLKSLYKSLSFDEQYAMMRAKLIDQYQRGNLGGDLLAQYQRQVQTIFGEDFRAVLTKVDRAYTEITQIINTDYKDLGIDVDRNFDSIRALESENMRKWGDYSDEVTHRIAKECKSAVLKNEGVDNLIKRLDGVPGFEPQYSETLARTFVKSHSQEMKNEKARIAEIDYFDYVGPPVRTSGPPGHLSHIFCIEIFKDRRRTFRADDINGMKNGQREPVRTHRGGYNCQHDWEPNPFYSGKNYKISFVTVPGGSGRDIVVARHDK
jgi:hypothetical protein